MYADIEYLNSYSFINSLSYLYNILLDSLSLPNLGPLCIILSDYIIIIL